MGGDQLLNGRGLHRVTLRKRKMSSKLSILILTIQMISSENIVQEEVQDRDLSTDILDYVLKEKNMNELFNFHIFIFFNFSISPS